MSKNDPAERAVRKIRRETRKQYSAEEKIRIVVSGRRGEDSIAELCRREGIAESLYPKSHRLTNVPAKPLLARPLHLHAARSIDASVRCAWWIYWTGMRPDMRKSMVDAESRQLER